MSSRKNEARYLPLSDDCALFPILEDWCEQRSFGQESTADPRARAMRRAIERYTKDDMLLLLDTYLVFTIHAVNQMRLESRDIARMEVEAAIRSSEIIAQYEYPESGRCDEVQIQAYDPRIFVAVGMCPDRLVVITTWRGEK